MQKNFIYCYRWVNSGSFLAWLWYSSACCVPRASLSSCLIFYTRVLWSTTSDRYFYPPLCMHFERSLWSNPRMRFGHQANQPSDAYDPCLWASMIEFVPLDLWSNSFHPSMQSVLPTLLHQPLQQPSQHKLFRKTEKIKIQFWISLYIRVFISLNKNYS